MACFSSRPVNSALGELAALVGVEDRRLAVPDERLLDRLETEPDLQGDREPPGQNPAAEPVDHGAEIDEAARHRNVGYVCLLYTSRCV